VPDPDITSWTMLNAYVDGELAPELAAEVAAALVVDREAAAQVATLTRLRAAVRTGELREPVPPFVLPRARPHRLRRAAMAAAALVVICAGGLALGPLRAPETQTPLSDAVAAHRLWLSKPVPSLVARADVALAGADLGSLPDLSLASLTLAHLALDPTGRAGGGVLAGYVGPNGCRVGLWIAPVDEALPMQPTVLDRAGLTIRAWRGRQASYALLGEGIDTARIDGIAALVARITGGEQGIPSDQLAALAEARSGRPACIG
jgi:anti-sigma factor RsiW